jgi:hypothetical protein
MRWAFIDEVAAPRADEGGQRAEAELVERSAADDRLHPGAEVTCVSPTVVVASFGQATRASREVGKIDLSHCAVSRCPGFG